MELFCNLLKNQKDRLLFIGPGAVNCARHVTFMSHKCNIPVTTTLRK